MPPPVQPVIVPPVEFTPTPPLKVPVPVLESQLASIVTASAAIPLSLESWVLHEAGANVVAIRSVGKGRARPICSKVAAVKLVEELESKSANPPMAPPPISKLSPPA